MKLPTLIIASCLLSCSPPVRTPHAASPIPAYSRDPQNPRENEIWYNSFEDKTKIMKNGRILNYTQ
jgi:hypothetical protein